MNNNKILSTNRTSLSLIQTDDLDHIHQLLSYPEVDKFNTLGIPKTIEHTEAMVRSWINHHEATPIINYTFSIKSNNDKQFIGLFGLRIGTKKYRRGEVWFKLLPKYWGEGYATETLIKVIDFAFDELHLHRIQAGCAVDNIGSIKTLEKAGMIQEGRGRKVLPLDSGWSDNFEYAILDSDPRNRNL